MSLGLTAEQYRRLGRYVVPDEDRTGHRVTHQAVSEAALSEYLGRHGAPPAGEAQEATEP